ncbi:MAG: carbohydrate kinase [Bryobacterales bacterium]|jgi:fructokinase|nr:carbohydrate kinase [Bryobacterales bacterium]
MKLVSIGEILWDVFPEGEFIGGAPFNLAAHAARLGNESYLLSAVGEDAHGKRALAAMKQLDVKPDLMSISRRSPTGTVSVSIDGSEEACYTILRPAAYDDVHASASLLDKIRQITPQWLCFGTLFAHPQSGLDTLRQVLEGCPGRRFYDVNLRDGHYRWDTVETLLHCANIVKLNEHELGWVARKSGYQGQPFPELAASLSAEYAVETICVTRGGRGCSLFHRGDTLDVEGDSVEVVNTVGAGDSFSAMFLHGISSGWPIAETARRANRLGAFVASQQGAVPEYNPAELLAA